jgi:hypothetical protein
MASSPALTLRAYMDFLKTIEKKVQLVHAPRSTEIYDSAPVVPQKHPSKMVSASEDIMPTHGHRATTAGDGEHGLVPQFTAHDFGKIEAGVRKTPPLSIRERIT